MSVRGVKSKYTEGRLKFSNGAVDDENVGESTAASTAISNYGVTRIMGGAASGVWLVAEPVLGAKKTILVSNSTRVHKIRTVNATINNSTDDVISVALSSKTATRGIGFDLYGASTVLWYLASGLSHTSSTQMVVSLTSTT